MTAPIDVLAQLKLGDGSLWVDRARQFQIDDMRRILADDGPWYGFLTRSRGSSKTEDMAAGALSLLLSLDESALIVWAAADADQGRLAIESIEGFADRSPAIAAQVEIQSRKVVAKTTGARIEVLAADAASSWGLRPFAVFVDELANWTTGPNPQRFFDSLASAVAKRSDARLVVLTTPSSPDHWSFAILEHARGSDAWWTSERRGPAPWMSAERIDEQKARLPAGIYEQLFEAVWTTAADAFLDPALLDAAFVLAGPTVECRTDVIYHAALDVGLTNDKTVLAVVHREDDHNVLDHMQVWQGTRAHPVDFGELEEAIVAVHARFGARLTFDPWQAQDLARRLRLRGIPAVPFNFTATSKGRLASALLESVNTMHLRLFEAPGLREELLALQVRQTSVGWSFDHRSGGHDDRAVALAMAMVAALEGVGGPAMAVFVEDDEGYWEDDLKLGRLGSGGDLEDGLTDFKEDAW